MFRKTLAALGLVLSTAGFIAFLVISIGVWSAKAEADRQLNAASLKAAQAGDVAERVIHVVKEALARARRSLETARAQPRPPGEITDPTVRFAMWKAKRDLPGEVEKARDAVGIASEAVIVAESLLDVFIEHRPDETAFGVKTGDVHAARSQLDSAASELKNARSILGVPLTGATAEQYSEVDRALATATNVTDQVDSALHDARRKMEEMKSAADRWSLRLAVGTSVLMALAALGQVFLFRSSWRGLTAQSA